MCFNHNTWLIHPLGLCLAEATLIFTSESPSGNQRFTISLSASPSRGPFLTSDSPVPEMIVIHYFFYVCDVEDRCVFSRRVLHIAEICDTSNHIYLVISILYGCFNGGKYISFAIKGENTTEENPHCKSKKLVSNKSLLSIYLLSTKNAFSTAFMWCANSSMDKILALKKIV